MLPKHIYIIRHGESVANDDESLHGKIPDYKLELSKKGWKQAKEAGEELFKEIGEEPLGVYCSPTVRTRETWEAMKKAELFEGSGKTLEDNVVIFKEDVQLREQERGTYYSLEDYLAWEKERDEFGAFYYRYPDGESGANVWDRARDLSDDITQEAGKDPNFPNHVLLVTHGFTMRAILMYWLEWTPEYFNSLKNVKNCEWVELRLTPKGKYKLKGELEERDEESGK